MIGLKLQGNNKAELIELKKPEIKPGHAIIKMATMALCGSDINLRYRPTRQESIKMLDELGIAYDPDSIPGHETTGIVQKTGTNSRLSKGDKVFIFPFIPSKESIFYKENLLKYCKPLKIIGYTLDGGNAEFLSIPEENCYKIPDNISLNQAAMMLDPIGAPFGAISRLRVKENDSVLILGAGPMGLGAVTICSHIGIKKIIIVEKVKERSDIAKKVGSTHILNMDMKVCNKELLKITDNKGPDVVIDCIGDKNSLNKAFELAKPMGRVGIIGEPGFINNVSVSDLIVHKDLQICGSWVYDPARLSDLYTLIRDGLKIEEIITHTFPLEQSVEAWDLFNTNKTGKIVIYQN